MARTLGFNTLRGLYRGDRNTPMTVHDLHLWEIAMVLDPWDERRADLRSGQVAQALVASRGGQPPDIETFVLYDPSHAGEKPGQTQEQMQATARAIGQKMWDED